MAARQIQSSNQSAVRSARIISSVRKALGSRNRQVTGKSEPYGSPGTIWNLLSKLRIEDPRNLRANPLCQMNFLDCGSPRY